MDMRAMQCLLALIPEGAIPAAAESLHAAQASLSRQMKDREEQLGAIRFERSWELENLPAANHDLGKLMIALEIVKGYRDLRMDDHPESRNSQEQWI